jgi:hypothetical protein
LRCFAWNTLIRIRAAEVNWRARKTLERLEDEDALQRRVRWLAVKALVSIRELNTTAAQSKHASDRTRYQADCKLVESILLKISGRSVA